MMKRKMRFAVAVSGVVVAWCATALNAAAFTNGSFESPVATADGYQSRVDASTVGGWTATVPTNSGVFLVRSGTTLLTPTAFDGSQLYTFNSSQLAPGGAIFQDFDTVIGTSYRVAFYVGRDGPGVGQVGVSANVTPTAGTTALASTTGVGTTTAYARFSVDFVAITTQSRLTFADNSAVTNSVDPKLDTVSVTVIPEPASAVATAAVLVMTGRARRRR